MRCLYCGIRLKIAEKGQMIERCPECSVRSDYESRWDSTAAQQGRRSSQAGDGNRRALLAATKSA
ncbi:MAG TPA: hypothetical protein VF717_15380 [Pyrinomonadaceae bacterium]